MAAANIQINQILLRRGNTAAASTYTGPVGEVIVDTGLNTLRVQNGITAGGTILATNAQIWSLSNTISTVTGVDSNLLSNAATQQTQINTINANLGAFQTYANAIFSTQSNAATQSVEIGDLRSNITAANSAISALTANAAIQGGALNDLVANASAQAQSLTTLTANADSQQTQINSINANVLAANAAIITANTAMKGYVDTQVSGVITAWTANAATQQGLIVALQSNAGVQADAIAGANAAIVTANTAMKGYVDAVTTAWTANAVAQQGLIVTLQSNAGVQADAITGANAAITTANTAMKGYVDTQVTNLTANDVVQSSQIAGANAAIITANTAMKSYVDAVTTAWTANAATQAGQLTTLTANAATQDTAINSINANIGSYYVWANANVAGLYNSILGGNANAATQQTEINSINANIGGFYTYANLTYGTSSYANANVAAYLLANPQTGTYSNANVTSYLPTHTGNIQASTILVSSAITATGSSPAPVISGFSSISTTGSAVNEGNITASGNLVASQGAYIVGNLTAGTTAGTNYHNIRGNLVLGTPSSVSTAGDSVLTILGYGVTATPILGRAGVHYSANVDSNATYLADSFGNTSVSSFFGRHARGTNASPLAVQSGDTIGAIYFRGYGATGYASGGINDAPGMYIVATENFTDSAQGTALILEATANGTLSSVPYVKIDSTGNMVIASSTTSTSASTGALVVKGGVGIVGNVNATTYYGAQYNFANGVNILSTVTGGTTYSNTNVAAYIPTDSTVTALQANIGSFYTYANATYTGGGGTTYSNANVVSMLTANSLVTIGNVNTYPTLSNITQLFIGNNTTITSGGASYPNATQILTNAYFGANGAMFARNTYSSGAMQIILDGGTLSINAQGSTTGNAAAGMGARLSLNSTSLSTLNGIGITSAGTLTVSGASGLVTTQATGALFNTTATTINLGGVATVITAGATNVNLQVGGSTMTGNISAGNITATHYGNSIGTTATYTGTVTAGNATINSNITVGNLITTGTYGNITGANVISANTFISSADITVGGNLTVNGINSGYAPNRPAFRVYGTGSTNWTTSNVNFKGSGIVVDYNQGSYFNSTTGVFTAPVAGLYDIRLNARVGNNNGGNQIMVLKNGQTSAGNVAVMWECDTNTGTATHFGVSTVMKLTAGDWLSANITVGNVQFDANDAWSITYIG